MSGPRLDLLEAIAANTEKIPLGSFTMAHFTWPNSHKCGAPACAVGHAIEKKLIPGLKWDSGSPPVPIYEPTQRIGMHGVADALNITSDAAFNLFAPRSNIFGLKDKNDTRTAVVRRIRQYIAEHREN